MITKREARRLDRLIKNYQLIIIAKHKRPDWDAQGSAIGLAHLINNNYRNKDIYVVGDRLNDDISFWPPRHFKPQELENALLLVVDTANANRIDFTHWADVPARVKIDHHLPDENYGVDNIVDSTAIACTQMIVQLADYLHWKWNLAAAENLYYGLVTDSGRFLFEKTNEDTFTAAAKLAKQGLNIGKLSQNLYLEDLATRRWLNSMFEKMTLTPSGIAYLIFKTEDYIPQGLTYNQVRNSLSAMAGIKEIEVWFVVIQISPTEYKVSLRSRNFDINQVATKYKGGGHRLASGATINKLEEVPLLLADLERVIKTSNKELKKHGQSLSTSKSK